jgi:membrane-associated phospholipid phosphatase
MWNFFFLVAIAGLLFLGTLWSRRRIRLGQHPGLFFDLWKNLALSFAGWNLALQLLAIALTAVVIHTGLEVALLRAMDDAAPLGWSISFGILLAGNFWHAALAAVLIGVGWRRPGTLLLGAGLASLQAVLTTGFLSGVLKLLSGRRGPTHPGRLPSSLPRFARTDDPTDFQFDFWNHHWTDGRFFWPSGHTATIMAFVSALVAFYPEKRWLPWVGYPAVLVTGVAMIEGHFHWPSDVFAGALIGHAVGWATGQAFRRRYRPETNAALTRAG